jgi:hypothetical protein
MEGISSSETSVTSTGLYSIKTQKTVFFMLRLSYKAQPVNAFLGKQSLFIVRTIGSIQI